MRAREIVCAAMRLSPAEVGREALASYRANVGLLLLTALIVFAPITLLEAAAHGLGDLDPDEASLSAVAEMVAAVSATVFTSVLGEVFYAGVVVAVVAHRRTGVRRELLEIARTLPYLRLTAVDVLFVLMVAVGLALFIVPGVVAFAWFALAAPVVEIEDRGVRAAFVRSRQLVRGSFWRVLAILVDWLGELLAQGLTAPFFALAVVVSAHHLIALSASSRTHPR